VKISPSIIEITLTYERDFAERMYIYNYRIYDKFRFPVVSLAVLTDERPHGVPLLLATNDGDSGWKWNFP
jgi:hypothetical protein